MRGFEIASEHVEAKRFGVLRFFGHAVAELVFDDRYHGVEFVGFQEYAVGGFGVSGTVEHESVGDVGRCVVRGGCEEFFVAVDDGLKLAPDLIDVFFGCGGLVFFVGFLFSIVELFQEEDCEVGLLVWLVFFLAVSVERELQDERDREKYNGC